MEYITQLYVTGQGAKLAQEIPRMVQDPRYAFCDFETELNKKGNILLESGRGPEIQGSIQVFSMIMQLYPNSAMTYKNLGKAYLKLGDTKKATELLNKAISLDTNGEQGNAAKEVLLQISN